ncbi:MAG TPA: GNAT family N-acetyltransferase [Polyangia bacterium]|jgi:CelD/BcsL family acetyltransferase involved in cellulose biosynthesis|nr:GNAT family N-acetyltransferase [Polyangia bacterium]
MSLLRPAGSQGRRLCVEELDHRRAIMALESVWSALASREEEPGPFYLPAWFAVQAVALARSPHALRLLVAHDRGRLVAALPLLAEERRIGGLRLRVLRSLSDDHSQRFDLVAENDVALAALWRHVAADPGWDLLELREVPEGSRRAGRLHELAQEAGYPVSVWPSLRSPYLPLPTTVDELDARLDAKFRANLRRRRRNLEKLGPVELERVTGDEGSAVLDAALDEGFALEQSGWKGAEGTAIACDPGLVRRYRALAHVFARRGELSLHFLRVGGRRVAFHFAIERCGTYYLLKPGYDEALRQHGPGHLLVWDVARALIRRGARELDFLGNDMEWKREWTQLARNHAWLSIYRPTVRGRMLHAWKTCAVPLLREGLEHCPARLQDLGRRWFRAWSAPEHTGVPGLG